MILKSLKLRELILLLRVIMLKNLQNQKLNKLIQVITKIMLLQHMLKLKLNKMIKLITWIRNQQKRALLSLSGNKSNNRVKLICKILRIKPKTCHFKHSITQSNQTKMELYLSIGLMLMRKTTEPIFSSLVKSGNQKPNHMFLALSKLKVWKELCLLFQR